MMGVVAKDDRLTLSCPGALEIRYRILCAGGGGEGAEKRQREDGKFHGFPPMPK
jgi:hypothetical protein